MKNRKSLRLKDYDYSQIGAYFNTICTKNRENLFGEIINDKMTLNAYGKIIDEIWGKIPVHFSDIALDEFVIMPNHVHGIIMIESIPVHVPVEAIHESPLQGHGQRQRRKMLIPIIIGKFKMQSAKQINILRKMLGISVWQRGYYDHIVRDENDLNRIRQYIISNPLKWDLDEENKNINDTGYKKGSWE